MIKQSCSKNFFKYVAYRIFQKVMLGLFFHMECRWVLSEPLPHHCSVIIILLHHNEVYSELGVLLTLFFLQRCFKCYRWYCSLHWIYKHSIECLYRGDTWEGSIFVKDEGCICLFCLSSIFYWFTSILMRVGCIFLLFSTSFSSVLWSQWP